MNGRFETNQVLVTARVSQLDLPAESSSRQRLRMSNYMKVRINNHLIPHQLGTKLLLQSLRKNQYPEDIHVDIVVAPQAANSSFQEEFGAHTISS